LQLLLPGVSIFLVRACGIEPSGGQRRKAAPAALHFASDTAESIGSIRALLKDVDDMEDMACMEDYVQQSQCVLLFLSKGYFASASCQKELDCTFKANKPVVVVVEKDLQRGAMPLEVLRDKCDHKRPLLTQKIFDESEIVGWYRIAVFQQLTLKFISQAMLHATPAYSHLPQAPALYSKGELLQRRIVFEPPVTLYASPHNPGAAKLGEELHAQHPGLRITLTTPKVLQASADPRSISEKFGWRSRVPSSELLLLHRPSALKKSFESLGKSASTGEASQMLLYLNHNTFSNGSAAESLAAEVRRALHLGMPIVLAHENDRQSGRAGCMFERFFITTPHDLIEAGLYRKIATPCHPDPYRSTSMALLATVAGGHSEGYNLYQRAWAWLVPTHTKQLGAREDSSEVDGGGSFKCRGSEERADVASMFSSQPLRRRGSVSELKDLAVKQACNANLGAVIV
jgi:hypothetical protein